MKINLKESFSSANSPRYFHKASLYEIRIFGDSDGDVYYTDAIPMGNGDLVFSYLDYSTRIGGPTLVAYFINNDEAEAAITSVKSLDAADAWVNELLSESILEMFDDICKWPYRDQL